MFKKICALVCAAAMIIPGFNTGYAENLSGSRVLHEDYEGDTYVYPLSTNDVRTVGKDGDDTVNTTSFANHTGGNHWMTLDTWTKGTVVYDLRAKYNNSYDWGFGAITTRDGGTGETWSRTCYVRIAGTEWKYYRIWVDYENQSVSVLSSAEGFESLEPAALTSGFGKDAGGNYAEGLKMFTVNNLSFDDFSIYSNPAPTDWTADIEDGAENIPVDREINISFFSNLDEASACGAGIWFESSGGDRVEASVVCKSTGIAVTPESPLQNGTQYTLNINGLENTSGEAFDDITLGFKTEEYQAEEILKISSAVFSAEGGEYTDVDKLSGDVKFNFHAENITEYDVNFTAIVGLYRNFGGRIDLMESCAISNHSIAAYDSADFETGAINIPAHAAGEYAIRVFFLDSDRQMPCADAACYNVIDNKESIFSDSSSLDIGDSSFNENTATFKIAAGKKAAPGRRVTYALFSESMEPVYIGQELLTAEGGFSREFHINEDFAAGTYTLKAKCDDEELVEKEISADPSASTPVCYLGRIDGDASVGSTLKAVYSLYDAPGGAAVEWYSSGEENGEYIKFADGSSAELTEQQSDKYIRFGIVSGGRCVYMSDSVKAAASEKPVAVKTLLETNFEDNSTYWRGALRQEGDGINNTVFAATSEGATAGYETLTREVKGTVIIQFRAKSLGKGYFTISTRQDSNYQKTINYTNTNGAQIGSWGYYRLVLDCDNNTGKVYYSPDSFTEMTETTGNIVYTNATGFNMLTFQNCCIDDIKVLNPPAEGAFTYDITDGAEVIFYSPMDISSFTPGNIKLYNLADKSDVTSVTNAGQFGFKAVPALSVVYNKSYRLIMNENIALADGTKLVKRSMDFDIGPEPAYNLLKISDVKLINGEAAAEKVSAGTNKVAFKAANVSGEEINAAVTLALYKNGNNSDYMVDFVRTNVTVAKGASDVEITTDTISVPEGNDGDYALRVFIGTADAPYAAIAEVLTFGAKTAQWEKNENTFDENYKVTIDASEIDYDNTLIKIVGNVHSGENKRVVTVIRNMAGDIIYIGKTESVSSNGSFSFASVIPPYISDGEYSVEVWAEKIGEKAASSFTVDTSKIKPTALNVAVTGQCAALETASAGYTYYHPMGTEMADIRYGWYISDDENGSYTKVGSESSYTFKSAESGKYAKCSVTVSDGTNTSGEVFSGAVRVIPKPAASNLSVQGTKRAGTKAYAVYEYSHADNAEEAASEIEWYISQSENGEYRSIGTGKYIDITSDMVGKYVKFSVIPNSSTGKGEKQESSTFRVLEAANSNSPGSSSSSGSGKKVGTATVSKDIKTESKDAAAAKEFADMQNHWAKTIVEALRNKGVVSGRTDTAFAPDEQISRGDFAALLARTGRLKAEKECDFIDLDKSAYYYSSIAALCERGIMQGYDGYIRPEAPITREEAATVAVRYLKALGLTIGAENSAEFADKDSISPWAAETVDEAVRQGIIVGDNENRFNPTAYLTRAEGAVIIYRLSGEGTAAAVKSNRTPSLAENLGIADTSGLFSGDYVTADDFKSVFTQLGGTYDEGGKTNITLGEAVKAIVDHLGYGNIAQADGGYPGGYIRYAYTIDLLDSIGTANHESFITAAQLMQLADNMLLARVYGVDSAGEDKLTYSEGDTYLYKEYSIYKLEGILNETEHSSIYGTDNADKDFIQIDGKSYRTKYGCGGLLGYSVKAYYDEKNEVIVYADVNEKKNSVTEIDAEEIDDITGNAIIYTPEGARGAKRKTLHDYIPVIVNNTFKGYLNNLDTESIIPERGSLTLIDNDNDGNSDVLVIRKYDLYVVDSVNTGRGFLGFKNADAGIQLKISGIDIDYTIKLDEKEIALSDISEWDVLAVLYSENAKGDRYYDINVIRRTVTGEFTGIDDDYIYIDGEAYKVLDAFEKGQLLTGSEYTFLFAGNDDILWYKEADSYRYGFLIKMGKTERGDKVFVKFADEKADLQAVYLNDHIKYNGKKIDSEKVYDKFIEDGATKQQMIKYCLNDDGTMRAFYTVQKEYSDNETIDKNLFFTKTNKASRFEHIDTYAFLYSMASGSTTFFISGDNDGQITEENISVGKMGGTSDSYFVCEFFDVDELGQAKASIFYRENSSISDTVPQACFVDKVYQGRDKEGNSGTFISYYYYFNGGYNTVFVEDDAKKEPNSSFYQYFSDDAITTAEDLQRGDIIQVAKNNEGNITSFRVLYDRSADNEYGTLIRSTNDSAPRIEVIYSPIYEISGSKIKVKGAGGNFRVYDLSAGGNYFKAYTHNTAEKTLKLTDYSNILSVGDAGSEEAASKAVIVLQSGYVRCIMIEDELEE